MSLTQEEEQRLQEATSIAARAMLKEMTSHDDMRKFVSETVKVTLIQMGIGSDDPIEMQKDMQHLREWRRSMENIRTKGVLTIVAIAVTGALAALWVGMKELIGR